MYLNKISQQILTDSFDQIIVNPDYQPLDTSDIKFSNNYLNRPYFKPNPQLPAWITWMQNKVANFDPQKHHYDRGFIINKAAKLFIFLGHNNYASDLCKQQLKVKNSIANIDSLNLNLIKIDRYNRKYFSAIRSIEKFSTLLHEPNALLNISPGYKKKREKLVLAEKIKLYLHTKSFKELIKICEKGDLRFPFIQEALIIGLVNTGQIEMALSFLMMSSQNVNTHAANIFKLRLLELQIQMDNNSDQNKLLSKLYNSAMQKISQRFTDVRDLQFCVHIAYVLQLAGRDAESLKLLYRCLLGSHHLQEEYFKAVILIKLNAGIDDQKVQKIVQKLIIQLYYTTRHSKARDYLLENMPELNNVQLYPQNEEIEELYTKLCWITRTG